MKIKELECSIEAKGNLEDLISSEVPPTNRQLMDKLNELISWQHEVEERLEEGEIGKKLIDALNRINRGQCEIVEPKPDKECKEELRVTDELLEDRNKVIDAIPPCPIHGKQCIPHCLEWVKLQQEQPDKLQELLEWVEGYKDYYASSSYEYKMTASDIISKIKQLMK